VALYRICLETGDSGQDATRLYQDPDLLGHLYVGPYLELQPDLAFVLADDAGPAGYVLGALDSRVFEERAEREWWPALRQRHPAPDPGRRPDWTLDEWRVHLFHTPWISPGAVVDEHPSHLHIDLLPRAQGNGHGRRLLHTLFAALRDRGSPGVHLGVGRRNQRALGFYRHIGFTELQSDEHALWLGLRL
jgi:ribosomal protein S18 acetylase RimI-like enzyme